MSPEQPKYHPDDEKSINSKLTFDEKNINLKPAFDEKNITPNPSKLEEVLNLKNPEPSKEIDNSKIE